MDFSSVSDIAVKASQILPNITMVAAGVATAVGAYVGVHAGLGLALDPDRAMVKEAIKGEDSLPPFLREKPTIREIAKENLLEWNGILILYRLF
ncbi:MAG: hypothetical protein D6732_22100 [Methanobacteriota archaeon]|nr:MAG: hypothetical protein D6732_22100 [Euryarchaeota archaeon]